MLRNKTVGLLALPITIVVLLSGCQAPVGGTSDRARSARLRVVRAVLRQVPLIDGHNDVPWQYLERVDNHLDQIDLASDTSKLDPPMHTDLDRLREGGLGAQFWSVYIPTSYDGPGAAKAAIGQIDLARRMVQRYSGDMEMAYTAADVRRIHRRGKIASLLGMEGGHSIENSLAVLRILYQSGARYMTITHSSNNDWADSGTDESVHNGLTAFGKEVIREMNRLGMLVDISHVSPKTMHDVLDLTEAPVIFSHSSARGITDHPRNAPDDVLSRLPENGGVIMITFVPSFVSEKVIAYGAVQRAHAAVLETQHGDDLEKIEAEMVRWQEANPGPRATIADVADHIDHVRRVAGIDHIGIGSDFDGISSTPLGLEDVSKYPNLFEELLRRGYTAADLRKIAGLNVLRVMSQNEKVARRLQAERPPSDALIEELDGKASSTGG